jgi:enoyl-CoA hydratase/carnithine racemase
MASLQQFQDNDRPKSSSIPTAGPGERPGNLPQRACLVWKRLPIPVIGALHGVAYRAGTQIALGTDIRIAAPDLRLSIMEIKWGMIPDVGITQTLRDLVPLDVAKELTFTGRIVGSEQAKALGLVTHLAEDPRERAMALAGEIANRSPHAIRYGKKLFEETWHADERTGLELETKLQVELIGSENQVEAIRANFEKRAPDFKDASLGQGEQGPTRMAHPPQEALARPARRSRRDLAANLRARSDDDVRR